MTPNTTPTFSVKTRTTFAIATLALIPALALAK